MEKNRLEAFSDGVIAILITIMVLDLKAPHSASIRSLAPLANDFIGYTLSFVYLGIYWNNHHHMLHLVHKVNGKIMWANLHLLFWLSLIPFVTGWVGDSSYATEPTVAYGVVLLMAGAAYWILQTTIVKDQGPGSALKKAIGRDLKGKSSPIIYAIAIPIAFWNPWASMALYAFVACMWFIPDRRIEGRVK